MVWNYFHRVSGANRRPILRHLKGSRQGAREIRRINSFYVFVLEFLIRRLVCTYVIEKKTMKIDRLTCTTALQQKSKKRPALISAARHQRAMNEQNRLGVQDTKSVLLYYLYIRSSQKKKQPPSPLKLNNTMLTLQNRRA